MFADVKARLRQVRQEGRRPRLVRFVLAAIGRRIKRNRELPFAPVAYWSLGRRSEDESNAELIRSVYEDFGGLFGPSQIRSEIARLIDLVRREEPQVIVEIGTNRGGTLFLFCQVAPATAEIVSIDLPGGRDGGGYPSWRLPIYRRFAKRGQTLTLMRGNSRDPHVQAALRARLGKRQIDFLMIDADHSYEGVKSDFEAFFELVRPGGLIALHDIVKNTSDPTIEVDRYWQDLRRRFQVSEIIEDVHQACMGIGLIQKPAVPSATTTSLKTQS